MRGDVALCEGRPRDAVASYERAVGSGEGALPRFDLAFLRSNIADAWLDLGEASTALAEIESAIASIAPIDLADAEAALGIWRARALAALGRKKEALAILDFATLELRSRPLQRVAYTEALLERGRLRTQGGSARGARQDLEEAIALSSATGARVLHARARIRLAELEIREGNHGRAARLLDLAAADAAVAPVEAAVEIARARLGIARGTLAEAERSARRAVERARGIPALQGLAERELRRAVGRDRSDGAASDEELVLDVSRCEAISSGRPVDLSSTKVIFRLVEALARAGRPLSKAAVFAAVWARRYRADLHDRNVYETVRRARRLLGLPERAATGRVALVSSEEGYALVGAVRIVGVDTPGADVTPSEREARRARIVELAAAGPIGNADVRRALGVFRTTATEDLAALANAGVLCRVGAGRGARYARVE
jgi:tetratricopeptide (TPR) repeat protein